MNTPTCTESPLNTIEIDGQIFRDLDHDGILSAYEDWRLTPEERAKDLVARLTINEKVGLMLHGTLTATGGPMGVLGIGPEYDLEIAAKSRLGIPVTVSTDPLYPMRFGLSE